MQHWLPSEVTQTFYSPSLVTQLGPVSYHTLVSANKDWDMSIFTTDVKPSAEGDKLAKFGKQVAEKRATTGWCFAGVAEAVVDAADGQLYGHSAFMAADELAQEKPFTDEFYEVTGFDHMKLPTLPAGAVIVWGLTDKSPNGHISISSGDGQEYSDHIEVQRTDLRGYTNFRLFMLY